MQVVIKNGRISAWHPDYQDLSSVGGYIGRLILTVPDGTPVEIGQTWEVGLDDIKDVTCARLNAKRDAVKFGIFTDSHGIRYDVHKDGRDNFTALEAKIANGLVLPDGFAWTDADNQQQPHTNATILALTTEILFWSSAVHETCVAAKTAIRDPAVTTIAQVKSIESAVVWPG